MNTVLKIMKYELHDLIRGRWILIYFLLLLFLTEGLFQFGGDTARVALSLMNIVLLVTPLITIIYGTMFLYSSREFIELLLCQPVSRKQLLTGLYLGFGGSLSVALSLGLILPVAFHSGLGDGWFLTLLLTGNLLTWIFTGLAFWVATVFDQRVKGMGVAIALWFIFSILYDGLILFILFVFQDYPLEHLTLGLSFLNPVDMARILILLNMDTAALMGYTGAVFKAFLGQTNGIILTIVSMSLWITGPILISGFTFVRKDW